MEQIIKPATSLWKWSIPDYYPNKWIGIYNRKESPDRFEFKRGIKVGKLSLSPKFSFKTDSSKLKLFGVLPNNSGSPLVSQQVITLLSNICKQRVQVIDTEIQTEDKLITDFKLLNIIKLVSSIDFEKSTYSLITGSNNIRSYQRLVRKLEDIGSNLLGREERCKSHILVADDIFESFESHNIKGIQFNPCIIE